MRIAAYKIRWKVNDKEIAKTYQDLKTALKAERWLKQNGIDYVELVAVKEDKPEELPLKTPVKSKQIPVMLGDLWEPQTI